MTIIDGKDGGIVPDKQTDLLNILLEVLLTEDDVDVLDQFAHFVRLEVLILRPGFQQQFAMDVAVRFARRSAESCWYHSCVLKRIFCSDTLWTNEMMIWKKIRMMNNTVRCRISNR